METTTTQQIKPRRPLIAELLSILMVGLGHIYCGRFGKGLILFVANAVLAVPGLLGILPLGLGYRITGIVAIAAGAGIWIYAILDARSAAKKCRKDYTLKDYNRWWIYLLLAVLPLPISVSGAFLIRETMLEAFHVPSISMYPTIHATERVLANKIVYRSEPIRRGDLAVYIHPNKRHVNNVKRIVALPGDTFEIINNELFINDIKVQRSKIGDSDVSDNKKLAGEIFQETIDSGTYRILLSPVDQTLQGKEKDKATPNFPKTTIPNGHCFVLGDNRNYSWDSRHYGPVPLSNIIGRLDYIYFPRWESLKIHDNE